MNNLTSDSRRRDRGHWRDLDRLRKEMIRTYVNSLLKGGRRSESVWV